jgi:hypothetical protein
MNNLRYVALAGMVVLVAGGLRAADVPGAKPDAAMLEAMKKGQPGEQHKVLEPLVGRFATSNQMWMKPGDKPMQSKGSSENTWVLGGRFVKMDMRGDMGGQPFEGVGYLGYDNVRGEYTGAWLDTMNTGITRSSGQYNPATKTLTESGTFSCPMTGVKDMHYRAEWKVVDNDTTRYTMYGPGPDGKEMKMVESVSKRVK